MGGGEKKKANQMVQDQYAKENKAADTFSSQQTAGRQLGMEHGSDLYGSLYSGYKNMMQPQNFMDMYKSFGGGAGYSAPQFQWSDKWSSPEAGYADFAKTGGVNAGDVNESWDSYRDFMKGGGI